MKAISKTGNLSPLMFKGVTKVELKDGYLNVWTKETMVGTYSLELFEEGSNNIYTFEDTPVTE